MWNKRKERMGERRRVGSEALFPRGKSFSNVLNEEQAKLLQNGSSSRLQLVCERSKKWMAEMRGKEGANAFESEDCMLLLPSWR